jgi:ankyrin repeat protein
MGSIMKRLFGGFLPTIHDAVIAGDISWVMKFLDNDESLANAKSADRKSPLHVAANTGNKQITSLLLSAGSNPNAQDLRGYTPLHNAASRGHKEIVELLLEASAAINPTARDGSTPLMLAMKNRHQGIEMLLKRRGGEVAKVDERFKL